MTGSILEMCMAIAYVALVLHLWRRSPALVGVLLLVIFTTTWRMVSTLYLDFTDGTHSWELQEVHGTGGWFAGASLVVYAAVYLAFGWFFSVGRLNEWRARRTACRGHVTRVSGISIVRVIGGFLALLLALLYIELWIIGDIPILTGMPRWYYGREVAGPVYKLFGVVLTPLAWATGFGVYSAANAGDLRTARRLSGLFFLSIAYLVLVGNKFTTPFYQVCFFSIPVSTLLLGRVGSVARPFRTIRWISAAALPIALLLSFATYKVFMIDRSYTVEYLRLFLRQRILIAPGQLSARAFERVFMLSDWAPVEAVKQALLDPTMPGNPSVSYLMFKELGPAALRMDVGYTDAFPGIAFELFGAALILPVTILSALALGKTLERLTTYTIEGRFFHALFWFLLAQGLLMYWAQGQIVFLASPRFLVKVATAWFAMNLASGRIGRARFFGTERQNEGGRRYPESTWDSAPQLIRLQTFVEDRPKVDPGGRGPGG